MPIHDWTRVSPGTYHNFHTIWIGTLTTALNQGLLPADYYALCEQDAADIGPDVLTLRNSLPSEPGDGAGMTAVAQAPPKAQLTASAAVDFYALRQRRVVIRHSSGDRIVALLEITSPANKRGRKAFRTFIKKAVGALAHHYHVLIVDLQPPSRHDPKGIHGTIWSEISNEAYAAPADKPFTLAAYAAGRGVQAYVNRLAVGEPLPDMPLFLTPDDYVPVPLEATYQEAWRGMPKRWRSVLEAMPGEPGTP